MYFIIHPYGWFSDLVVLHIQHYTWTQCINKNEKQKFHTVRTVLKLIIFMLGLFILSHLKPLADQGLQALHLLCVHVKIPLRSETKYTFILLGWG